MDLDVTRNWTFSYLYLTISTVLISLIKMKKITKGYFTIKNNVKFILDIF